jgi:hypothetical protein
MMRIDLYKVSKIIGANHTHLCNLVLREVERSKELADEVYHAPGTLTITLYGWELMKESFIGHISEEHFESVRASAAILLNKELIKKTHKMINDSVRRMRTDYLKNNLAQLAESDAEDLVRIAIKKELSARKKNPLISLRSYLISQKRLSARMQKSILH